MAQLIYSGTGFELKVDLKIIQDTIKEQAYLEENASRLWLKNNDPSMLWYSKYYLLRGKVTKLELAYLTLLKSGSGKPDSGTKRMVFLYFNKIRELNTELLEMDSDGVERSFISEQDYIESANELKNRMANLNQLRELISGDN